MFKTFFKSLLMMVVLVQLAGAQEFCPIDSKNAKPKELVSYTHFEALPVLEDGRMKPLDTYARQLLLQFSGRR